MSVCFGHANMKKFTIYYTGSKNMGDNMGEIVYQNYPSTWFRLQHGSATWTQNIVL